MKIKIDFSDFCGGFNKTDNYFYNLLKEEFDVEISENPDFIFFSVFDNGVYSNGIRGREHKKYNCKKIFYSGEPTSPNYNDCDYSMSFDWIQSEKHLRLPLYAIWGNSYYDLENNKIKQEYSKENIKNFLLNIIGLPKK